MSIQVIKRAASGHTNPANRRWPTLLVAQRARRQLVSYDPTAGDRLSELWGRRGAQWERPNKYCDKCVQVGIEAGHVKAPSKRLRAQCEAASSSPMSMPDDKKLLAIERIFDCRCAAAPPARAHNALSRVCGMAPQMLQPRRQGRGRYGERMHHGGGHVRERRLFGAGTLQAQGR